MIGFAIGAVVGFLLGVKFAPGIYVLHAEYISRDEPIKAGGTDGD